MVDRQTVERRLLKLEQSLRKLNELSKNRIDVFKKFAHYVLTWL